MLELIIIIVIVFLSAVIPGRIIIEKFSSFLKLSKEEKLTCSFGISFFLYYLIGFAGYILKTNPARLHVLTLLVIFVYSVFLLINGKKFMEKGEMALIGYFIAAVVLLMSIQMLLPIYSGGAWYGDWYEHYQRMQFFLKDYKLDYKLLGIYLLPARPPLFNIVTYFYQSFLGDSFWVYQAIGSFMNIVVLFPIYLILKRILKIKFKYVFLLLAGIFLLNPAFMRNLTYSWTRHLTNYYVLLGIYFYLKGRNKMDFKNIYFGFALLGVGQLTHYSAVVCLVVILMDFVVISLFRLKENLKPLILTGLILLLIISTWYIWAINAYGFRDTFVSSTAYIDTVDRTLFQSIKKDWLNLRNTIIPYFIYPEARLVGGLFAQKSKIGLYYDSMLVFYCDSLIGNLTVTLTLVLLGTLILKPFHLLKRLKEEYKKSKFRDFLLNDMVFWIAFPVITFLIGIHVNTPQLCGCMHITLQPLAIILVCFVIKKLELVESKVLKAMIVLGIGFEALIGIGSRVFLEMPVNFRNPVFSRDFYGNYYLKLSNKLTFLYDKFNSYHTFFIILAAAGTIFFLGFITHYLFNKND